MIQEAKVENLCAQKRYQSISIDATQRCCLNCMWYEQYYRRTRGNIAGWVGTAEGFCLLHDKKPRRSNIRRAETWFGNSRESIRLTRFTFGTFWATSLTS